MPNQFDATARINVDLGGFRSAANQANRSGGEMERVFRQLHQVLGQVELVNRQLAADLNRSLRVYNQISQAARNYATAIQALGRNEQQAAQGVQMMNTAFEQMRVTLGRVQGIGDREFQRLQRTLTLYQQMASALNTLARAYAQMTALSQSSQQAEERANRERERAAATAQRLAAQEQRLQVSRERTAASARNAATNELRAQTQLLRVQQQIANARRDEAAALARQTAAQARAARGLGDMNESLFSLRSALGDVTQLYQGTVNVLQQIGTAAIGAAISHEAAFAQIERVTQLTGGELENMRHQFEALAAELPTSFEETARVAQLASQTGVANEQLLAFTNTVVQFSVTTGVASEQAALLFARIMTMRNIPAGDVENFASTILDLGITSAATEDEILRLSESIATVTDIFGLSIPATLGLASAFANLRIRPELARGALTRVFAQLNTAVREGGAAMDTLQSVLGGTQEELTNLLSTDPDSFFLRFIEGMSTTVTQGGLLRQVLADLGVNAVRDIDVISRLANNYDLLAEQVSRARVEYLIGNTLQEQSNTIFRTAQVEIANLSESFTNLASSTQGYVLVALTQIVRVLQELLQFANSLGIVVPILGAVATALGLAVAAFVAYRIAVAAAWRGVLAYSQAQSQMRGQSNTLTGALQYLVRTQQQQAQASVVAAAATSQAAAAQAAAARGVAAFNTAAVASRGFIAASVNSMNALSATASGLRANFAASTTALRAQNATLAATAGITTTAATSATNLNRAAGLYAATSVRMFNVQQGLNSAYAASSAATAAAAAATTASAASMGAAGRAAQALSTSLTFLRANWVGLLGVAGLLVFAIGGMVTAFRSQTNAMREANREALNAVGGIAAYQDALVQDTQAARDAVGGINAIATSLRESGTAATEAGRVYRLVGVAAEDLSGSLQERTERELALIQVQREAIELAYGNRDAIQQQAEGTGAMADAAREALANLDALTEQEAAYQSALDGTTLAIGERAAALVQQQFQEALVNSELLNSAESYERLQAALSATNFDIDDIVTGDTEGALERIRDTIAALEEFQSLGASDNREARIEVSGLTEEFERLGLSVEQIGELGGPTQLLDSFRFLEGVIQENQQAFDEAQRSAAILTELGLDPLANALRQDEESADAAASATQAYEERLGQLGEAYNALIDPTAAWTGENEEAIQSIEAFTERLRQQVTAQQEFAQNLAVLASQGFGALVEQLQGMGPEGAAAAAELVDATQSELEQLNIIATQAGEGYINALAGTMDQLSQLDIGREAAQNISEGIVAELNRVSADGGDLALAAERMINILQAIAGQDIDTEVVLDILGAQNSLTELQALIQAAEADGSLDAEGVAALNTILYQNAMTELQAQIDGIEAAHGVDAQGEAQLDPQGYYEALRQLQESAAVLVLENLIDVEGDAALSTDQYEAARDALEGLADRTNENGDLDVEGEAFLQHEIFDNRLNELFRITADTNRSGRLNVRGAATLNTDDFVNTQLPRILSAAQTTGYQIQQALTRTATVSVVYANVNNPPAGGVIRAATGGWIHGPGGPKDDRVPAMLSSGEYVVNAKSARKYADLVEAINSERGVDSAMSALMASSPTGTSSPRLIAQQTPMSATRQAGVFDRASLGPVFNISNNYPQAEPTSVTINRSLAYAATISGV